MVHITLNGIPREVAPDLSIHALLEQLQLAGKRVAVERNGEIVPRSLHGQVTVTDGDRMEIVVAVGGG